MHFEGTVTIRAARDAVWRFLTDPRQVSQCAPGLESLELLAPERFRATASVGFGSVRARFVNDVEWLALEAPERARMKVHGTAPGSAVDATSEMLLSDASDGATLLRWSADVSVVGTLASIAARLMGSVAQKLTDAFFAGVSARIEALVPAPRRALFFGPVALDEAAGKILAHDAFDADGRVALPKGRVLTPEDVASLRTLGRTRVEVAEPGSDDVREDDAARRVAQAASGAGVRAGEPRAGRVDLVTTQPGVLRLDPGRLWQVNACPGVALATRRENTAVRAEQIVATVKIVPFAVPENVVQRATVAASDGGALLRVDPFVVRDVSLVLFGTPAGRPRVIAAFEAPLSARVEALGATLRSSDYVALDGDDSGEEALAEAIRRNVEQGAGLILLAGENSIADRHDLVPRAIERAGGAVEAFGVPVDPGALLLLAYAGQVPIVAVPPCGRHDAPSALDLVLPRLLAVERLTQPDLIALAHGGLLDREPVRAATRDEER